MSKTLDIEKLGVFQVFTGGGTGSGFLLDASTLITNCHVVAPYRTVAVEQRDKVRISGAVRRIHPRRDLAIVELAQPFDGELLQIHGGDDLAAKAAVDIVGFPVGLPLSVTQGVVSNPRQLLDGQHYVQTDAAINPGNSGGPILDEDRRVIAVTTCKLTSADMVGFGIPGDDLARVRRRHSASKKRPFGVDVSGVRGAARDRRPLLQQLRLRPRGAPARGVLRAGRPTTPSSRSSSAASPTRRSTRCSRGTGSSTGRSIAAARRSRSGAAARSICASARRSRSRASRSSASCSASCCRRSTPRWRSTLSDNLIRLNLTFHMTDVFAHRQDGEISTLDRPVRRGGGQVRQPAHRRLRLRAGARDAADVPEEVGARCAWLHGRAVLGSRAGVAATAPCGGWAATSATSLGAAAPARYSASAAPAPPWSVRRRSRGTS